MLFWSSRLPCDCHSNSTAATKGCTANSAIRRCSLIAKNLADAHTPQRAQNLTVSFKQPFDSLTETTTFVRSTNDVSAQCARWWRWRELKSSAEENNFLRSSMVRHKISVNIGDRACLNLLMSDCRRSPQRTKLPIVCPVLSRPRRG